MPAHSRRSFLATCLRAAAAVACAPTAALLSACRDPSSPDTGETTTSAMNTSDEGFVPNYVGLHQQGQLAERADQLWATMRSCTLCPRMCRVNRIAGECGQCGASARLSIASFHPHFGEERGLVGAGGSGTVFFSHCSLRCVFCINWEISHGGEGHEHSVEQLAEMMLHLQRLGCHNINVVTPSHYSPHIVLALDAATRKGLRLPLVYNTCGWERLEILKLLDGVVDIYLPDFKYSNGAMAAKYSSGAATYPEMAEAALKEMHRQVGVAKPDGDGLIRRGLMIRHLVMPNNVSGTKDVVEWIAANLPKDTFLNLMSQYTPHYKAREYPEIARRITATEYGDAVKWARAAGLSNLDVQGAALL